MNPLLGRRQTQPRVDLDTDVYTLARQRTAYVMDTFDEIIVAFSGGKDSTAVLNIALEVARSDPRFARHLPLRVVHFDEEAIPFETEEYVRRVSQRDDVALEWYCLPVKHRNACSRSHPYWWPWAPEDEAKWCRPMPPEAITHLDGFPINPPEARLTIPDLNGLLAPGRASTAMLMGIRAQESVIRRRAVSRRKVDNYIVRYDGPTGGGNIFKAYTIYDWQTEDVWTAAKLNGWDYNRAYDRMAMAGVTPYQQRCSPAFGEEPLNKIHTYATCFPEVWEKMSERVPGIGAAVRYARTELWAFGSRPDKPAHVTWPDYIAHYVSRWTRPAEQTMIAGRLRETIRRHYRHTTDPILPTSPHPRSGVSWEFLLTLAMRGDFKERRQETMKIRPEAKAREWASYTAELTRLLADGVTAAELGHPRALPPDPSMLIPTEYRQEAEQ
ncbi:phosphoadenosine phosphosulfate reductase family protein [Actinomadura miaoliensis]|uniref:Phosphoadenosine phosphosulfate reductase n=1 Tax=Actinomadura miaoliensis TaxID=430685 RepID=A0ABP7WCD4_9ACTN